MNAPKKWIGISGTWQQTTDELKKDLQLEISKLLNEGCGIVTGGALGVDYLATEVALEIYPDGSRLKILLPTSLSVYAAHYRKRADEGIISHAQAENLISQLEKAYTLNAIIEGAHNELSPETYYLRNTEVVNASDELTAFQVNKSAGTQDTIDKARLKGIPVKVFEYITS